MLIAAIALLICGSLGLFYILIGYPLLLATDPFPPAPPVRKDTGYRASVSVILAVYNGGAFLRQKLDSLLSLDYPAELLDVLVVSDGSTDETEAIAQAYLGRGVRLLRVPHAGKASALNAGIEHATGDILFFTDVRQPLDRRALIHLVANFADPTVGAVTGELRILDPTGKSEAALDLYWRYELWARSRHSHIDSILNTTGCIYAMRRNLAAPIPVDTLTDDAVLPLRAFFQGYRVIFEPAALAFDYPSAPGGEFRRKLRTLAGLCQVCVRIPAAFGRSNRMRLHFVSHKVARLIMPWTVIAIWVGTVLLPASAFRSFLTTDELMMLALVVLDPWLPKGTLLRRVSSASRTFLVMNAAALLSPVVFLVNPTRLWRPTQIALGHAGGQADTGMGRASD